MGKYLKRQDKYSSEKLATHFLVFCWKSTELTFRKPQASTHSWRSPGRSRAVEEAERWELQSPGSQFFDEEPPGPELLPQPLPGRDHLHPWGRSPPCCGHPLAAARDPWLPAEATRCCRHCHHHHHSAPLPGWVRLEGTLGASVWWRRQKATSTNPFFLSRKKKRRKKESALVENWQYHCVVIYRALQLQRLVWPFKIIPVAIWLSMIYLSILSGIKPTICFSFFSFSACKFLLVWGIPLFITIFYWGWISR